MPRTSALLALALLSGAAAGQPDPKKKPDDKPVTKVYSIGALVGDRGKAAGVADADAVIKLVFEAIPELRDLRPGADGAQVVERDGGKLEVRAPAAVQEPVKDLLDALARLQDVAVDVKAEVLEFTPDIYKEVLAVQKALNDKSKPPVLLATGEDDLKRAAEVTARILRAGKVVQTSTARLVNAAEATVSARKTVTTFPGTPDGDVKKDARPLFVKEGFSLQALPVVSADRRFIRFKLTEQSTAVTGVRKRNIGDFAGKEIVAQSLETEDLGATGSAVVADGGTLLFKLAYAPKDNVWVVVLKPTIFIQAEEDERKREGKPVKP